MFVHNNLFCSLVLHLLVKAEAYPIGALERYCTERLQGPVQLKLYISLAYIFRSKLVCLSKLVKVTDNRKGTSLLQILSILLKIWVRTVLWYRLRALTVNIRLDWRGSQRTNTLAYLSNQPLKKNIFLHCYHQPILLTIYKRALWVSLIGFIIKDFLTWRDLVSK